jgi:hypothetical protein
MTQTYAQNIIKVYKQVTPAEMQEGLHWYDNARDIASNIANGNIIKGAGVLSAFSPLTPWWRTLELATDSLATGIARTDTLSSATKSAQRIINGEHPLDVFKGLKTRAFFSAIAGIESEHVTVDQHAFSIAVGEYHSPADIRNNKISVSTYRRISDAYHEAANTLGISPIDLQAITWVHWRNVHFNKAARKGEDG